MISEILRRLVRVVIRLDGEGRRYPGKGQMAARVLRDRLIWMPHHIRREYSRLSLAAGPVTGVGCAFQICVGCDSFVVKISRSGYLLVAMGNTQKAVLLPAGIDE